MSSLPPRRIHTARLDLSCWRPDDAEELRAALDCSDAHLRPWIPFMQDEPRSLAQTRERVQHKIDVFDAGQHSRYAIRLRTTQCLVGETMLLTRGGPGTLEAGYWLHAAHCGHGYAREATAALIPIAFDVLGALRVAIVCDEHNAASIAVAKGLGAVWAQTRHVQERGTTVRLSTFLVQRESRSNGAPAPHAPAPAS